ncbi:MAG: PAS domain-containing protein [Nitrospinota bacterium]|nr:MAG: PAS domain-containing protein [Nitrospinota bacterium]
MADRYTEHILTSLSDGLMVVDETFAIVVCNPALEEMLGLPASKVLHQPLAKIFTQAPFLCQQAASTFQSGKTYVNREAFLPRRDGTVLTVSLTTSPLFDSEGKIIGTILVIRDRTRMRELEAEARRLEALASFSTIAAGVAHEIKNPLLGIRGAAQLLQEELPTPELREYTEVIIKETQRLNTLIETLLDLTRPQRLKREPQNIHQLLDRVLFLLQLPARQKGVTFQRHYDPSLPPIWLDAERITQVFFNLLQNGLDAMEHPGVITLTTRVAAESQVLAPDRAPTHFALIEIRDQGTGIPEEIQDKLFTPLFTTKSRGSGLGLVISYRIVNDHGGRLLLKSRPGQGTVASVYLPLSKQG